MFDLVGRLFGSSNAGEKIIDGAISGIDKMWYTAEEKAQDAAQAKREVMSVYVEWLKGTSGSRVARRIIAIFTMFIWGFSYCSSAIFQLVAVWADDPTQVAKLVESSVILAAKAASVNTLVAVIFAFYFGGPAAVEISKNALNRFASKGDKE